MQDSFTKHFTQPTRIATQRFVLRRLTPGDADAIQVFASDPEVTRFMDWGPNERAQTIEFIERAASSNRTEWTFGIVDREGDVVFGTAGINDIGPGRAEIGYCLAKSAWGRGLGTEVAKTLIELGFERLGLHRIQARCDPSNIASARVLEKCGMRFEGHLRDCVFIRGEWRDRRMFAILETDRHRPAETDRHH